MKLTRTKAAVRAYDEMQRQCSQCTLRDFGGWASVMHEDGSSFLAANAFTRVWVDPEEGKAWVFMFSEHNEPMYWPAEDLVAWDTLESSFRDDMGGVEKCARCDGLGEVSPGPNANSSYLINIRTPCDECNGTGSKFVSGV